MRKSSSTLSPSNAVLRLLRGRVRERRQPVRRSDGQTEDQKNRTRKKGRSDENCPASCDVLELMWQVVSLSCDSSVSSRMADTVHRALFHQGCTSTVGLPLAGFTSRMIAETEELCFGAQGIPRYRRGRSSRLVSCFIDVAAAPNLGN